MSMSSHRSLWKLLVSEWCPRWKSLAVHESQWSPPEHHQLDRLVQVGKLSPGERRWLDQSGAEAEINPGCSDSQPGCALPS